MAGMGNGQAWRGPSSVLGTNYSFRNPSTTIPRNNNPMGNQQSMKPAGPQYSNPAIQAGQSNLRNLNQSIAQSLNRPIQRRNDTIAGVQPGPMINPNAARNVLMGQDPDADLSMRPLNIPGMKFDPNRNAMVKQSPYEARGITPGAYAAAPEMAFEKFTNPDDFRVATGGMASVPPPPARSIKPQNIQASLDNARMARAARMRGVTSAGIDQWRKTSPIALGIQQASPDRLAMLTERMQNRTGNNYAPPPAPTPAMNPGIANPAPQNPAIPQPAPENFGNDEFARNDPALNPPAAPSTGNPAPADIGQLKMRNALLQKRAEMAGSAEELKAIQQEQLANEALMYQQRSPQLQNAWRAVQRFWPNFSN